LRKDRSEPSSLLIVDGRQYLIDCGIGTIQRMIQAGIQSETIQTIFITPLECAFTKTAGVGGIIPKSERKLLGQSIPAFNPFLFILFRTLWSQRLTRNPFAICRLRTFCHSMGGGGVRVCVATWL
jgi:hypothetical protein